MRPDVLTYLRCPVCADRLDAVPAAAGRTLRCPRGHSFDLAKQGYVHLAGRTPHVGDTAAMVAARSEFLAAGHFDFLSAALAHAADANTEPPPGGLAVHPPLVVDAGAGTGRHLSAVLDALPSAVGLALDAAKPAVRRAARAHPRAGAVRCDTWRALPLVDDAASVLLNVFAPRNGAEFHRVLRPTGVLLVATPAVDHLAELIAALGLLRVDPDKPARVAAELESGFVRDTHQTLHSTLRLAPDEVRTLVEMGPSAWHTDPERLTAKIAALAPTTTVTAAITLTTYRPKPG